jgi:hypothetical protein
MAYSLPVDHRMDHHCQRCNGFTMGSAYRVTSREFGVMMLDMIVCYECFLDARRLGLDAQKIRLRDSVSESHHDQAA